jgi:IstB-like ATP binding protein
VAKTPCSYREDSHHSVVIVAATGLGKTCISCALANAAVRRGHSALYLRSSRLHDEVAPRPSGRTAPEADGQLGVRTDVLVIDDFLLRPSPRPGGGPARGQRRPRRPALHHRHEPVARGHVARSTRRADRQPEYAVAIQKSEQTPQCCWRQSHRPGVSRPCDRHHRLGRALSARGHGHRETQCVFVAL